MKFVRLASAFAFAALTTAIASSAALAADPQQNAGLQVLQPYAQGASGSLAHAPQADHSREAARREIPLKAAPGGGNRPRPGGGATDGALQTSATTPSALVAGTINVDGVGVGITATYKDCCTPPDTNLAVGPTQVVQWVNLDYAAFDKSTGAKVLGPLAGNTIWAQAGFTNGCGTNNDGDPIVKYDAQNGRWLMTQFSVSTQPYLQCVAISNTSDFVNTTWKTYAYSFGTLFNDYPKVGIWPDAYYFSFNMFRNGATFSGAYA
jgi:hypothetical protein